MNLFDLAPKIAVILGILMPQMGLAMPTPLTRGLASVQPASLEGKAFAVFVASYNTQNNEARGGVAGTAFFVSPHKAITAFHVLQDKSFKPAPGFERIRIWLVHENYPAIEVTSNLTIYKQNQDSTVIEFGKNVKVPNKYIYATDHVTPLTSQVSTEGFMANSTGPILERHGADIDIISVPKLERLVLNGTILGHSDVNLHSADLNLQNAACVQLSYQPIRGFSGGPVVANGKVIGMNSFADPEGNGHTWALQVTNLLLN